MGLCCSLRFLPVTSHPFTLLWLLLAVKITGIPHLSLRDTMTSNTMTALHPESAPLRSKQISDVDQPEGDGRDIVEELMKASKSALYKTSRGIVDDKVHESKFFDSTVEDRLPKFDKSELRLGRILGRGGFCIVIDIEKVKIAGLKHQGSSVGSNAFFSLFNRKSSHSDNDSGAEAETRSEYERGGLDDTAKRSVVSEVDVARSSLAKLAKKRNRKGGKYALKQVLPDGLDNFSYLKGLVDLSMEAKFLANLDHPNIIHLCGVSSKGPGHFIIIERLQETLSARLKTWVRIDRQCRGVTGKFTGSKRKEADLFDARIGTAYNITRALAYLHEKKIIFRDLKPDNCGFDLQDNLKLFDFGLAKELKESDIVGDGLYKLTGMTGALRYSKYSSYRDCHFGLRLLFLRCS
jgi:hypothetical protein